MENAFLFAMEPISTSRQRLRRHFAAWNSRPYVDHNIRMLEQIFPNYLYFDGVPFFPWTNLRPKVTTAPRGLSKVLRNHFRGERLIVDDYDTTLSTGRVRRGELRPEQTYHRLEFALMDSRMGDYVLSLHSDYYARTVAPGLAGPIRDHHYAVYDGPFVAGVLYERPPPGTPGVPDTRNVFFNEKSLPLIHDVVCALRSVFPLPTKRTAADHRESIANPFDTLFESEPPATAPPPVTAQHTQLAEHQSQAQAQYVQAFGFQPPDEAQAQYGQAFQPPVQTHAQYGQPAERPYQFGFQTLTQAQNIAQGPLQNNHPFRSPRPTPNAQHQPPGPNLLVYLQPREDCRAV